MTTSANDRRLINYVANREVLSFANARNWIEVTSKSKILDLIREMVRVGKLTEAQAYRLRFKFTKTTAKGERDGCE